MGIVTLFRGDIAAVPGMKVCIIVEGHVSLSSLLLNFQKTVCIEGWWLWQIRIGSIIAITDNADIIVIKGYEGWRWSHTINTDVFTI
jgi:hypothetical protein